MMDEQNQINRESSDYNHNQPSTAHMIQSQRLEAERRSQIEKEYKKQVMWVTIAGVIGVLVVLILAIIAVVVINNEVIYHAN